jgi:hypothetical protein
MGIDFKSAFVILFLAGALSALTIWGVWELFDSDETITTKEPIVPEIKIIVEDNTIDTLYIYRQP